LSTPALLQSLLTAPGPPGHEEAPAAAWREAARGFADEVTLDAVGTSVARVNGAGDHPLLAVVGHVDEIGLLVSHVNDRGFLHVVGSGGWDPQVLVAQNDFYILDFEGEPARPVAERRRKQCVLVDVAGMLRSLDYAAALAVQNNHEQPAEKRAAVEKAVRTWQTEASQAFLAGHRQIGAELPSVPRDPQLWQELLELFLIDKALYELRYEINMRPDWVGVPLRGLLALVQTRAVNTADAA